MHGLKYERTAEDQHKVGSFQKKEITAVSKPEKVSLTTAHRDHDGQSAEHHSKATLLTDGDNYQLRDGSSTNLPLVSDSTQI